MFETLSTKMEANTIFSQAVQDEDINLIEELFKGDIVPDIDLGFPTGTAIFISASKKNWNLFNKLFLLEADLDIPSTNSNWCVIHECVKNAPLDIIRGILPYCNPDAQTVRGENALMVAIREKRNDVIELLLTEDSCNLKLTDKQGNNVAHLAANNELYDVFLKLVKLGVPLNKENKQGKLPGDLINDENIKQMLPNIEIKKNNIKTIAINKESDIKDIEKDEEKNKPVLSGLSKIKKIN